MSALAFLCQILSFILGMGTIIVLLAYYVNYRDKRIVRLIYFVVSYLLLAVVINAPIVVGNFTAHYISYIDYLFYYLFLAYTLGLIFYSYPSFILELVSVSISKPVRTVLFAGAFLPLYFFIFLVVRRVSFAELQVMLYILGTLLLAMLISTIYILFRSYKKLIGLWRKLAFIFIVFSIASLPIAVIDLFIPGFCLNCNGIFPFSSFFVLALNLAITCRILSTIFRRNREKPEISLGETAIPQSMLNFYGITERESEIALAILEGKTNNEIAQEKSISLTTVKKHVYNIFQKTNARNRIELTNILRNGK